MVSTALPREADSQAPGQSRARRLASWFAFLRRPKSEPPPPRRLLFLDDDARRAQSFLSSHPQAVWVQTVEECLELLVETWDEVHLDHDLGGKTFVDVRETDCGMEVIRWLCREQRDHLRTTRFFVHTHNSVAGLLMVLQMRTSGYRAEFRPFGLDLEQMLAHNEAKAIAESGLRARWSRIWQGCVVRLSKLRPRVEPAPTQPERDRSPEQ
jgi:hypothetical protein